MNRTIKDATVKRYRHDDHGDQLRAHLRNFVDAYNFARRRSRHPKPTHTIRVHLQMLDFRPEKIQA